jgi:lysylphosphatidylglycerol synthetase-like protein (DUF2156 family)
MAWAVRGERASWAIVAFAVLLTLQQFDLVFLPLAASWKEFGVKRTAMSLVFASVFVAPWALAAPHAFVLGAITYELHYPFAFRSLSVFQHLSDISLILAYLVLIAGVVAALGVAMWRARHGGGFIMGCALLLTTLNLVDKVSNFNEWQMAAGLVLAAGAEALRHNGGERKRDEASAPPSALSLPT